MATPFQEVGNKIQNYIGTSFAVVRTLALPSSALIREQPPTPLWSSEAWFRFLFGAALKTKLPHGLAFIDNSQISLNHKSFLELMAHGASCDALLLDHTP